MDPSSEIEQIKSWDYQKSSEILQQLAKHDQRNNFAIGISLVLLTGAIIVCLVAYFQQMSELMIEIMLISIIVLAVTALFTLLLKIIFKCIEKKYNKENVHTLNYYLKWKQKEESLEGLISK